MPVADLTRNDLDYSSEIIYAKYEPDQILQLMKYYPDRSFYKYVRDPEEVRGKLERLRY